MKSLTLSAAALVYMAGFAAAQSKSTSTVTTKPPAVVPSKPTTPTTPSKPHPKATRRGYIGSVDSIDTAGKVLNVKNAKGVAMKFTFTDACRVTVNKKQGKLSDVTTGAQVKVVYDIDSKNAVLIEVKK